MNSIENLRFDNGRPFPRFSFQYTGYFRKHFFPCSYIRYRNTRSPYGFVFPLQYLVLPNFHLCFYNCMATRKMFSIYVKYVKCWHYSLLSLSNVVNLLCLTPLILLNQSVEILGSFHFRISLSRLERGS